MKTTKLLACAIVGSALLAGPAFAQSAAKGQFITEQFFQRVAWFQAHRPQCQRSAEQ